MKTTILPNELRFMSSCPKPTSKEWKPFRKRSIDIKRSVRSLPRRNENTCCFNNRRRLEVMVRSLPRRNENESTPWLQPEGSWSPKPTSKEWKLPWPRCQIVIPKCPKPTSKEWKLVWADRFGDRVHVRSLPRRNENRSLKSFQLKSCSVRSLPRRNENLFLILFHTTYYTYVRSLPRRNENYRFWLVAVVRTASPKPTSKEWKLSKGFRS